MTHFPAGAATFGRGGEVPEMGEERFKMEEVQRLFAENILSKLGPKPDWEELKRSSLAREYGLTPTTPLPLARYFEELKNWKPLDVAVLPKASGILAVGAPARPNGVQFPAGDHVPYTVQFIGAHDLHEECRKLRSVFDEGELWYVSYVVVQDAHERSDLVSKMRQRLERDAVAPVPDFLRVNLRRQ